MGPRFDLLYSAMPWDAVDTVVFDIGNVLVHYDPQEIARALFPDEAEREHMLREVFYGEVWQELDRGTTDFERAAQALHARCGYPAGAYMKALRSGLELKDPVEEGWRAAARCKREGKRLLLLSNYSREGYLRVRERLADRFALFDGAVVSSFERQLKPEAAIYETLIRRYALDASRALFIDDMLPNVEAACRAGLCAFHFGEPGALDRFMA